MKSIDPHVHLDSINWANLEAMSLAGIVAVIADAGPVWVPSAQAVLDFYERTLKWDAARTTQFSIDTYVTIGINMLYIPHDWPEVIKALPKYVKTDRVVGMGEIGLDPRSATCPDVNKQEEVLRAQLEVVKEYDVPVRLHLPPTDKMKWLDKYFKLIDEFKLNKDRVVLSHAESTVLKPITDFGCMAEITMQPWRKLGPEEAARILQGAPLGRVMLDTDAAHRVASDVVAVPKAAMEMKRLGFKDDDINQVVYNNPRRVFNLR